MPTIESILAQATTTLSKTSDSAALDAEILLCQVLNKNRSYLRAWPEKNLTHEQYEQFEKLLQQRAQGTPIAHLTGVKEFWSRDFRITPDVLIPRPDTELLIELALELIPANQACKLLDLGTGSGIIAVTLAAERPNCLVVACDQSEKALVIAQENARSHQIKNVQFFLSDWFDQIPDDKFDLIISNPPYIAADDPHLQQGDVRFDPDSALIADQQGLKDIIRIADQARQHLTNKGHLLIEHGYDQQQQVQEIFQHFAYRNIQTYTDLAGHPRASYGQLEKTLEKSI